MSGRITIHSVHPAEGHIFYRVTFAKDGRSSTAEMRGSEIRRYAAEHMPGATWAYEMLDQPELRQSAIRHINGM